MWALTNNVVKTNLFLGTPHPLLCKYARVQASVQFIGHCCICDSTGHSLQRCLAALKIVSPSSTSYSERMILTDFCLKHGNHACANCVSAVSRNRQVNADETPPEVVDSPTVTENITRHLQVTMQEPHSLSTMSGLQYNLLDRH